MKRPGCSGKGNFGRAHFTRSEEVLLSLLGEVRRNAGLSRIEDALRTGRHEAKRRVRPWSGFEDLVRGGGAGVDSAAERGIGND